MDYTGFCQSCSMPLDAIQLHGRERNGSVNKDYCKFCYQEGKFTNDTLTLEAMKEAVFSRMAKDKVPADIIAEATARLPHLKRWKKKLPELANKSSAVVPVVTPEKHPLEKPPMAGPLAVSEDDLDHEIGDSADDHDPMIAESFE